MFNLTHKIGGITFRTESDVQVAPLQTDLFEQFFSENSEPEVKHRILCVDPENSAVPDHISHIRSRLSNCICFPSDGIDTPILRTPSVVNRLGAFEGSAEPVGLELHPFSLVIRDHVGKEVDYFYIPQARGFFEDESAEVGFPVFRRMFSSFLPAFSATMVHSSALVRKGKTALFLAPDEGGKTTVVESSNNGQILSDDQIILRKQGDTVYAHGTPWGKISHGPLEQRVSGLFVLEQAEYFELSPLKPVDAIQYFWREHLFYRVFLPKRFKIKAFEIICAACRQAPVYRMRFPKDYVDWHAIDSAMEV